MLNINQSSCRGVSGPVDKSLYSYNHKAWGSNPWST